MLLMVEDELSSHKEALIVTSRGSSNSFQKFMALSQIIFCTLNKACLHKTEISVILVGHRCNCKSGFRNNISYC